MYLFAFLIIVYFQNQDFLQKKGMKQMVHSTFLTDKILDEVHLKYTFIAL